MTYRIEGGTKLSGGHRPWNSPETERRPPEQKETETQQWEREACLSCRLPECNQHMQGCMIRAETPDQRQRRHRAYYKEIPDEFIRWAFGPMTNKEWAEKYGVSVDTICRWRRVAGIRR